MRFHDNLAPVHVCLEQKNDTRITTVLTGLSQKNQNLTHRLFNRAEMAICRTVLHDVMKGLTVKLHSRHVCLNVHGLLGWGFYPSFLWCLL